MKWLEKQPYVDRARIGIWGWSYGGYMTCMAMLRAGDVFKAGFAGAPVTDWRQYDTIYTERYMGTPRENPDGYMDSSPVNGWIGLPKPGFAQNLGRSWYLGPSDFSVGA